MKKSTLIILLALASFFGYSQSVEPAPSGKAVVYFVRPSVLGVVISFTYFDNTKVIGKFNGTKYMRYECEPGEHLFWVKAENRDYVKAELEDGKTYFIDVEPKMGAIKAGVKLTPINPKTYNMEKINNLLGKKESESFTKEELWELQKRLSNAIKSGIDKYKKMISKGDAVKQLTPDMNFQI